MKHKGRAGGNAVVSGGHGNEQNQLVAGGIQPHRPRQRDHRVLESDRGEELQKHSPVFRPERIRTMLAPDAGQLLSGGDDPYSKDSEVALHQRLQQLIQS